jgi:hypothetical protein
MIINFTGISLKKTELSEIVITGSGNICRILFASLLAPILNRLFVSHPLTQTALHDVVIGQGIRGCDYAPAALNPTFIPVSV